MNGGVTPRPPSTGWKSWDFWEAKTEEMEKIEDGR